jgi:hypothetical protein
MAADIRITIRERTCRQCITASRSTDIFRNGVHRPDAAGSGTLNAHSTQSAFHRQVTRLKVNSTTFRALLFLKWGGCRSFIKKIQCPSGPTFFVPTQSAIFDIEAHCWLQQSIIIYQRLLGAREI